MSGVQGALETRTITSVATPAALAGLDATPFSSGELAYVVSLATGTEVALFVLKREDTTSVVDNVNVIAVGPTGAVGRWLRLDVSAGTGSGNSVFEFLAADFTTGSLVPVPILTTDPLTTTEVSNILVNASVTGDMEPTGTAAFGLLVDGLPVPAATAGFTSSGEGDIESASYVFRVENVPAGAHIFTLVGQVSTGAILRIRPSIAGQGQMAQLSAFVVETA